MLPSYLKLKVSLLCSQWQRKLPLPQPLLCTCVFIDAFAHKVHTYVEYIELCLASSKILTPHPFLHPASVSSPRTKGRAVRGGGGSRFLKTRDIGFASYSIISLRLRPSVSKALKTGIRIFKSRMFDSDMPLDSCNLILEQWNKTW